MIVLTDDTPSPNTIIAAVGSPAMRLKMENRQ
jgi:hypothetical protein